MMQTLAAVVLPAQAPQLTAIPDYPLRGVWPGPSGEQASVPAEDDGDPSEVKRCPARIGLNHGRPVKVLIPAHTRIIGAQVRLLPTWSRRRSYSAGLVPSQPGPGVGITFGGAGVLPSGGMC